MPILQVSAGSARKSESADRPDEEKGLWHFLPAGFSQKRANEDLTKARENPDPVGLCARVSKKRKKRRKLD